ncbi:MAG: hypothetical protein ACKPEN_22600 [Planktothrix sp.]|uniref:hypothetical protein n=1 Tax=Planktothrix sp. TaxID=3088171 RepID=UPI0038D3DE89
MSQEPDYEAQKAELIAELQARGIKHNPEKIVRIAKREDGKIIFLEEGKVQPKSSGLAHILDKHQADFAERGISEDQIPDAIMTAVLQGVFIRYQNPRIRTRPIYEFNFNGQIQYIAVTISDNGYIVGANPSSL